ncbi:MAG: DUF4292 domain-containing protein [bacterium]
MRGAWAAALGSLLAGVAGCASMGVVPPPPEAARHLKQPVSLLEQVWERRGRFHDLRGVVEITLNSPQDRYAGKAVLLLQAKGSIRLEPLNFFGQPLIYIVAHNERLEAYDPGKGNYFRGRATARNLYQWLGIPLFPEEVVRILWGGVPPLARRHRFKADWDGSVGASGSYRLEFQERGRGARRWWVDARTFLPVRFQALDSRGKDLLTVRYKNYRRDWGIPLPVDVEVEVERSGRTLDLHYGQVKVNRGLAPLAFHLPVPRGTRIIPIDR